MAEFILYWKEHYMDSWPEEKLESMKPRQRNRFESRYQRGDILEVWPNRKGAFRVSGNPDFAVIKVPEVDPHKKYSSPEVYQTGIEPGTGRPMFRMLKRRAWHFRLDRLPPQALEELESKQITELTREQFDEAVEAKK